MPVRVTCSCGRSLNLGDNLRGKRVKCPACASVITVPGSDKSAEESRPAKARPAEPPQPPQSHRSSETWPSAEGAQRPKPRRSKTRPAQADPDADWLDESSVPSWEQPSLPPRTRTRAATANSGTTSPVRRKSSLLPLMIVGGIGVAVVSLVGIIFVVAFVRGLAGGGSADPGIPDVAKVKFQESIFPPRPEFRPSFPSGVLLARTKLTGSGPAESTQMNMLLPAGEHPEHSLGCVLIAPAGTMAHPKSSATQQRK